MSNISRQNFESSLDYLVVGDSTNALGRLDLSDTLTLSRRTEVVKRETDEHGVYDLIKVHTINFKTLPTGKADLFEEDELYPSSDYTTVRVKAYINPDAPEDNGSGPQG